MGLDMSSDGAQFVFALGTGCKIVGRVLGSAKGQQRSAIGRARIEVLKARSVVVDMKCEALVVRSKWQLALFHFAPWRDAATSVEHDHRGDLCSRVVTRGIRKKESSHPRCTPTEVRVVEQHIEIERGRGLEMDQAGLPIRQILDGSRQLGKRGDRSFYERFGEITTTHRGPCGVYTHNCA